MNRNYIKQLDDYRETISHGIRWIQINRPILREGNQSLEETVSRLKEEIDTADAIVIGAGAGLSTAAGFTYSGERFRKYFSDFEERFGIHDMYSGGFYPYPDAETRCTPVFYVLNPIQPKMAKNNRFYPGNGYFMKELSRITDSERLRRCA